MQTSESRDKGQREMKDIVRKTKIKNGSIRWYMSLSRLISDRIKTFLSKGTV